MHWGHTDKQTTGRNSPLYIRQHFFYFLHDNYSKVYNGNMILQLIQTYDFIQKLPSVYRHRFSLMESLFTILEVKGRSIYCLYNRRKNYLGFLKIQQHTIQSEIFKRRNFCLIVYTSEETPSLRNSPISLFRQVLSFCISNPWLY